MCHCLSLAQNRKTFQLKVGVAKVDITPKDQPTPPATGKYDHERGYMSIIDTLTEMITEYLNNSVKK